MNESPLSSFGLTLLDIIACALGAAVVIAVIFSVIKQIPQSLSPDEFIIVETNGRWDTTQDRQKLDLNKYIAYEINSPSGERYYLIPDKVGLDDVRQLLVKQKGQAADVNIVSARDFESGTQRSYMVIIKPQMGTWQITPYYFDYTQWTIGQGAPKDADYKLEQMIINLWTKIGQCSSDDLPVKDMVVIGNGEDSAKKSRTMIVTVKPQASSCERYKT